MKLRVVEIGGTHIRRADLIDGEITNLSVFRTREILKGDILGELEHFANENWQENFKALVFLVAGPVDKQKTVKYMPNFPAFPPETDLTKKIKTDVPILVLNDMTAAVTGMAFLLQKEGVEEPFWGLTWSTGLGAKFWDKEIIVDEEVGHMNLEKPAGKEAEAQLGGNALTQEAGEALEQISAAYQLGEDWAIDFYNEKARVMGKFLALLDRISPADLYVFKGAIAKALLPSENIRNEIVSSFLAELKIDRQIKLVLSPQPDKDSFLGAGIMAEKLL